MRIEEILATTYPCFSFEFFPPKTDEGMQNLYQTIRDLKPLEPAFVSVTYGAGGSTRDRTIDIVKRIKRELDIEAMAHFTCVDATVEDLRAVLGEMEEAGVENVLALRGDPPQREKVWRKTEGGLGSASELAALVSEHFDFCIGGACHPEVHPEAPDLETDLRYLKAKVDAGARFLITQLFFDNQLYFDFVPKAREAGIDVPIVPGIMPIASFAQIRRFTEICGASIPPRLEAAMEDREGDAEAEAELGVAYASLQCADLLARGAPGIHFYTLNKSPATRAILSALKAARPWEQAPPEPAAAVS
jgi:methylenetetrahydrofolate reductase (NADPH)